MNTMIWLNIFLIIHLTGLALMIGTTVADAITFNVFSKSFQREGTASLNLLGLMDKLSALLGVGAALLIISGTGMMIITHGAFAHQIWFKIKLGLIVMIILNGFLVGGRWYLKLKQQINKGEQVASTINSIKLFYVAQMILFFTIILLSIFKFS